MIIYYPGADETALREGYASMGGIESKTITKNGIFYQEFRCYGPQRIQKQKVKCRKMKIRPAKPEKPQTSFDF